MFCIDRIPYGFIALAIEQNCVVDPAILLAIIMRFGALPDNLVPEIVYAKHGIHHAFEIVACGRVAVEIDTASGCEDSVHLGESGTHESEVCTHRAAITGYSVL